MTFGSPPHGHPPLHPNAAINHPGTPRLLAEYDTYKAQDRRSAYWLAGVSWASVAVFGLLFLATGANNGFLGSCLGLAAVGGITGLLAMFVNYQDGRSTFRQELLSLLALNEWTEYSKSYVIIAEAAQVDWKIVKLHVFFMGFIILRRSENDPAILCKSELFESFKTKRRKNPIIRHTHGPVLVAGDPSHQTAIATTPEFEHIYIIRAFNPSKWEKFSADVNDTYRKKLKPYLEHYLRRPL